LPTDAGVAGVVDQNKQLEPRLFSAGRDPVGHLKPILALLHLYILAIQGIHGVVSLAQRFNRDHQMHWDGAGRGLFLRP
jgi:hypothetical protein